MDLKQGRYIQLLKNLMPRGSAWPRALDTFFHDLFAALADEMVRLDNRISVDLVNEADPSTTNELLPDWERVVGIPDGIFATSVPLEKRRAQVRYKLAARGGQSRPYFIGLAADLGFTITITEYRQFVAGSVAGGSLTNGPWIFTWKVTAPSDLSDFFSAGISRAGDPLSISTQAILENAILKYAPAHTLVLFEYT